MELMKRACEAAIPRKKKWNGRRPAYWWTEKIADLRRQCLKHRRIYQRARGKPEARQKHVEYQVARKKMRDTIKESKKQCWVSLCEEVNSDPWGKAYQFVMRKIGKLTHDGGKNTNDMATIVNALFPTHPELQDQRERRPLGEIPLFNQEELTSAARSMKTRRAPGPDGVPPEVIKIIAARHPQFLLDMFNTCLQEGQFPTPWKNARLVLIDKGKGEPNSPSSYRPLCMLDTVGKLFEKLIKGRLTSAVIAAGDLSEKQHGFRKGRSTIGAVEEVVKAVLATRAICHGARPLVLLVTLDVRNAFNSARWKDMLHALEVTFQVPEYLMRLIRDYLTDRYVTYETAEGKRCKRITAGAFQGSILGPDLWNIAYDSLLREEMPEGTFLVAYADDVAAVIVERTTELVQLRLDQVMRRVGSWMRNHGLELATAKTEMIYLTRKRIDTNISMVVLGEDIPTKQAVKYLGITLDQKLTYWTHLKQVAQKASKRVALLSRIMPNIKGPKPAKRKLLMATAQSIILYGAELWGDAMEVARNRKRLNQVQRTGALRVTCAYRTVSESAVLVIAGAIPIDLLAKETRQRHLTEQELGRKKAQEEARKSTWDYWQGRWENDSKGRWTARLIKQVKGWVERKHGEVDFYLTQFLTSHGYFRRYLHRMGKVSSPNCIYCQDPADDAEHTLFVCNRWQGERCDLQNKIGVFDPDSVIGKMLSGEDQWIAVQNYVHMILRAKKEHGAIEG